MLITINASLRSGETLDPLRADDRALRSDWVAAGLPFNQVCGQDELIFDGCSKVFNSRVN